MKKITLAIAFLTSLASVANAQNLNAQANAEDPDAVKIGLVRVQEHRILVQLNKIDDPDSCYNGRPGDFYYSLPQKEDIYSKNMYAALLTAHSSGRNVTFLLSGCDDNYPRISQIFVR